MDKATIILMIVSFCLGSTIAFFMCVVIVARHKFQKLRQKKLNLNWKAVCQIEDLHLRLAVALADRETREKFSRGFPELFRNGEKEKNLVIPLSAIHRKIEEEFSDDDAADITRAKAIMLYCGIQVDRRLESFILRWECEQYVGDEQWPIPQDLRDKLNGKVMGPDPIMIVYNNHPHFVASLIFKDGFGELGQLITPSDEVEQLWLVDTRFIDVNT